MRSLLYGYWFVYCVNLFCALLLFICIFSSGLLDLDFVVWICLFDCWCCCFGVVVLFLGLVVAFVVLVYLVLCFGVLFSLSVLVFVVIFDCGWSFSGCFETVLWFKEVSLVCELHWVEFVGVLSLTC